MEILLFAEPEHLAEARAFANRYAAEEGVTANVLIRDPRRWDPDDFEGAECVVVQKGHDHVVEAYEGQEEIMEPGTEDLEEGPIPLHGPCDVVIFDPEEPDHQPAQDRLADLREENESLRAEIEELQEDAGPGLEDVVFALEHAGVEPEERTLTEVAEDVLAFLRGDVGDDGEEDEGGGGTLPDDFPYVEMLRAAGLATVEDVQEHDDLTEISGIGESRADEIREAL